MTSARRTDFADFVLDLLDFTEEKIREALDDENSRPPAPCRCYGTGCAKTRSWPRSSF
jgi:hypothetical protein